MFATGVSPSKSVTDTTGMAATPIEPPRTGSPHHSLRGHSAVPLAAGIHARVTRHDHAAAESIGPQGTTRVPHEVGEFRALGD